MLSIIDRDGSGFVDMEELKDHYTLPDGKFNFSALNQLVSAFETIQHREIVSHAQEVTTTVFKLKKEKENFFNLCKFNSFHTQDVNLISGIGSKVIILNLK